MPLFSALVISRVVLSLVALSPVASGQGFQLVQEHAGNTFFDGWDFYGYYDNLTLGHVTWVDEATATKKQLAYVNTAGNAILKVDNTGTVLSGDKRDAVRITTQKQYGVGSDIVHLPFGCSVPDGGEIDIIEAVNLMTNNQMALHTNPGCTHLSPSPTQKGNSGELDCSQDAGCTVIETAPNSFGSGFNSAGGGVFATQFDVSGIYIWFWERANVPKSILSATSTSSLATLEDFGPPSASYPAGLNCDIPKFFDAQSLVLDITLCGKWAGVPELYNPPCHTQTGAPLPPATDLCYVDNVPGNGSNYHEAYFEIKYIRAYSSNLASNPTQGSTTSGSTQTRTTTSHNSPTKSSDSAPQLLYSRVIAFLAFALLAPSFC